MEITSAQLDILETSIEILQDGTNSLSETYEEITSGLNTTWLLYTGTIVFFMQAGFSMLEAGSVRTKNTGNVLFKNIVDAAISSISFWLVGYAFAFGKTSRDFIGSSKFALSGDSFDIGEVDERSTSEFPHFFFQAAFAATATTIVSGAVAERCKLEAYFVYAAIITAWIYPVVVHWCWGEGWLSPYASDTDEFLFNGKDSNNFIDFAGSGVVHVVGGTCGLVAAIILGPRTGRFSNGNVNPMPGHSAPLVMTGAVILWFGWFGFNAGSTLCMVGDSCSRLAAEIAVVTAIAASSSVAVMIVYQYFLLRIFDLPLICNSLLAGLVSITASCAVVPVWGSFFIGTAGCLIYIITSQLLLAFQIDDPLDASPIHGFCGIWGVLSVGIFGNDDYGAFVGFNGSANGHHPFRTGEQFAVQIVGVIAILGWTLLNATIMFLFIKYTVGFRVKKEVEAEGLDSSEHGIKSYNMFNQKDDDLVSSGDMIIESVHE